MLLNKIMIDCLSKLASISTCFWWITYEIREYRKSITVASRDVQDRNLYEKLNQEYLDPELDELDVLKD